MRGLVAITLLAGVVSVAACTPDLRVVAGGAQFTPAPVSGASARTVHERQGESHRSRQMRFLGYSRDGETGFKEHLVGWGGPGTDPRKVVVPFPVVVHDGPYRWEVDGIVGGFYRTPRGGYCWNYRYRSWPAGAKNYRLNYAFACQNRSGRWVAYKNQRESPAGSTNRSHVNLQRLMQQMLR